MKPRTIGKIANSSWTCNTQPKNMKKIIEKSFSDFSKGNVHHEEEMKKKFGKCCWDSHV